MLGFNIRPDDDLIFHIFRLVAIFWLHDSLSDGGGGQPELTSVIGPRELNSIRSTVRGTLLRLDRPAHLPLIKTGNCFSIEWRR